MKSGLNKGKQKIENSIAEVNKHYDRLKEFYENAPEGITVVDINTLKFVDFNEKALELLHFSSIEILRQGPLSISPEFQSDGRRSDEKAKELIEKTLNGEKQVFEWLIKTGKGEILIFEVRLALLPKKSEAQRIYASFVDIMDRKRIEAKMILQNEKLSEIAFLQSHQVRQPVANILGLVNLFNFKNLNDPFNAELIMRLELATKKFDTIIKDVTDQTKTVNTLIFGCKQEGKNGVCRPTGKCQHLKNCFVEQAKID